jgi:hypothetical protein
MSNNESTTGRWLRNRRLAAHLCVSEMTIWRWKRDPKLNTPPPSLINGIEYNDRDAWDAWMRAHAVSRVTADLPAAAM